MLGDGSAISEVTVRSAAPPTGLEVAQAAVIKNAAIANIFLDLSNFKILKNLGLCRSGLAYEFG